MASFRTALLATAASALSLAAAPAALADGLSFTNYTTSNTSGGLGSDFVYSVYASGSRIYAATDGGLSIAQQSDPTPSAVPGPCPCSVPPAPSASPANCVAGCGQRPAAPADPLRPDPG